MKIYGVGVLYAPGTNRVVHNFDDGPFDTVNPALIQEARRRGFSFTPPAIVTSSGIVEAATLARVADDGPEKIEPVPKDTLMNKIFKKRGRPSKGN